MRSSLANQGLTKVTPQHVADKHNSAALDVPAEPTDEPHFADLVAAASRIPSAGEVPDGDSIDRADLAPEEQPIVNLLPHSNCAGCPNAERRRDEPTFTVPPHIFESMLEFPTETPSHAPPTPWGWAGLDWSRSPCEFRRPSLDVLARVVEPSRLSEALFVNRILPDCACTSALHAAADHDGAHGLRLDDLRQEADLKRSRALPASVTVRRRGETCPSGLPPWPHVPPHVLKAKLAHLDDRPNVTPDPGVVRRQKAAKLAAPVPPQDLFAAFGVSKSTK